MKVSLISKTFSMAKKKKKKKKKGLPGFRSPYLKHFVENQHLYKNEEFVS